MKPREEEKIRLFYHFYSHGYSNIPWSEADNVEPFTSSSANIATNFSSVTFP